MEEKIVSKLGRTFFVNKNEDKHFKDVLTHKSYQLRNLCFLRKCCPIRPIIIDVGAHIGENTIEYATWASKVYGFEPCISSFNLALKNIYYNQHHWNKKKWWWYLNSKGSLDMTARVNVYNVGLGNKKENVKMRHYTNSGHTQISEKGNELVKIKTLDSYNYDAVDIIKMDVEGYELFVLEGAKQTIERCRPVIQLEVNETHLKNFNVKPEQLFNFFNDIDDYLFVSYKGALMEGYYKGSIGVSDYFFIPGDLYDVLDKKVLAEVRLSDRDRYRCGLIRNSRFYEWYKDVVINEDKILLRR